MGGRGGAVCGSVEGVEGAPLLVKAKNRAFPLHDQFEFKLLDPTRFRAAKCARTPPRRRPAQCYSISQQQKFNFRMRPRIRERAHSLRTEVRVEERGSTGALKERKPAQLAHRLLGRVPGDAAPLRVDVQDLVGGRSGADDHSHAASLERRAIHLVDLRAWKDGRASHPWAREGQCM